MVEGEDDVLEVIVKRWEELGRKKRLEMGGRKLGMCEELS